MPPTKIKPPLRLEYRKPEELTDNPSNWREHEPAQIDALNAILDEVGWAGAALYNERTKHLIDGHCRKKIPDHLLVDGKMPVLIGDWSEEEEKKILATFDPIGSMASANKDALGKLLFDFQTDNPALRAMLESLANQNGIDLFAEGGEGGGLTDPDSIPAPPDKPITQRGDRWILGDHVLLCGDSSNEADVERLLKEQTIQLVVTDPPYNVAAESRTNNAIAAGNSSFPSANGKSTKMRAKDRSIANDSMTDVEYDRVLLSWFKSIARVLDPGRAFYIWGGYANCKNYPGALEQSGLYFSQAIIWIKDWPVMNRKDFMGNHEWCFYGWREGKAHYFTPDIKNARDTWEISRHRQKNKEPDPKAIDVSAGAILSLGKGHEVFLTGHIPDKTRRIEVADQPIIIQTGPSDVWRVKKVNPQQMVHLTEKPVELAIRAMKYSSMPGENVLDLFGGSGSTLIAAEMTGRKAFLMELDEAYCDVIRQRWEQFTGAKAILDKESINNRKRVNNNGQAKAKNKTAKRKAKATA